MPRSAGDPPFPVSINPNVYRVRGRLVWQVLLLPLLLAGLVPPCVALWKLPTTEGSLGDAVAQLLVEGWYVPVIAVIGWLFYGRPAVHWLVARRGYAAEGTISETIYLPFLRGPKHHVRFRFVDRNGRARSGRERVQPDRFAEFQPGAPIEVWYLGAAPFLNTPSTLCEYSRRSVR